MVDGQERSSQTRGHRARRGCEHAGRNGEEEVQERGGGMELREIG